MKKLFWILLQFLTFSVLAQPNWNVVSYTNSTTAYGIVTIDGEPAQPGDWVGAFVNNECRAAQPVVINQGVAYVSLLIQGEAVETAGFKIWDSSQSAVMDASLTTQTSPGQTIGLPPNYLIIDASNTVTPSLAVDPANKNIDASPAGSVTFSVTSNSAWTAVSDQTWCTVTTSGSGNGTITVDYTENTSTSSRTATITVSVDGVDPVTVTVTQAGTAPTLAVDPENKNIDASPAGSVTFSVTSNSAWTAVSDQTWCTVTASGTGNGDLTATYSINENTEQRVATITVTVEGGAPIQVTLTQAGKTILSQPDWNVVSYTNSTTAYGIVTIDGEPAQPGDWVGAFVNNECRAAQPVVINQGVAYVSLLIQGEAVETAGFKIWDSSLNTVMDASLTTQTSPGQSIGLPPNYLIIDASNTITPSLAVDPANKNIDASPAGSVTFSVTSNSAWTAVSDQSWCSVTTSGSGNGTITVDYTENTSISSRTATITVSVDGVDPVTVTVTQAGKTILSQPDWNVVSYTNSTTAYGIVTIDGEPAQPGDWVGAFVNNECRAAQQVVINQGVAYVSLLIQGEAVETTGFKIWDSSQSAVMDASLTTQTSPGQTIGLPPNYLIIDASNTATPSLAVDPANKNIDASPAGSVTFSVTSNSAWTAVSDQTWCTVAASGTGNGDLTATYSINENTEQRVATITVTVEGGAPIQVTLTQAGKTILSQPDWNVVSYTNSTTAYGIVTIDGEPAQPGDWVGAFVNNECRAAQPVVINQGVAYVSLLIQGEAVETTGFKIWDSSQSAVMDASLTTQTSPGQTIGLPPNYLIIDASNTVTPSLAVDPQSQNADASPAGQTSFTVTSNTNWTAASDQTWCSVTTSGSGNGTITVDYTENTSTSSRTATITVSVDGVDPVTVTVTQAGTAPTLAIDPANKNIDASPAGNVTFSVRSNSAWTAVSDQTWCTVTASGTGNGDLTATYSINENTEQRVATITVTAEGGAPIQVTLTQAGKTILSQPDWNVVSYTNSTTAYGIVTIDGEPAQPGDWVGAFVNNECRAAQPVVINQGVAYVSLLIQGEALETAGFKIWDSSQSAVMDASLTTQTSPGQTIGLPPNYLIIDASNTVTPSLAVDPTNKNIDASPAGSVNFTVTSNTNWTAASDQTWCSVTTSGSGNGTITVDYTENTSTSSRTATITVSVDGVDPVTVTVTQAGTAPTLAVDPANKNIDASPAGSITFSVTSNSAWTAVSDQSWCSVTTSGSGNGTITVDYTENTSISSRTATITVSVDGVDPVTVTVTQAGTAPTLAIDPANKNIDASPAGSVTFSVRSNSAWTAVSDQTWCTVTASGTGNGDLTATYSINENTEQRVATITVTVEGGAPIQVTLTQAGKTILSQPDWNVVSYTNSTTAYGIVTIDGEPAQPGDWVGAFVNNECRAMQQIIINEDIAYINIQIQGETLEFIDFKVWSLTDNAIYNATITVQSNPGGTIGMPPNYIYINALTEIIGNDMIVSNLSMNANEMQCFNAYNTVTVAGDGTTVVLSSGSSANFIAGQSIRFLPGFKAQAGSYVDAHITTNGTFCDQLPQTIVAVNPVMEKSNPLAEEELDQDVIDPVLKVYPNPNNGRFTISLENFRNGAKIMIYNSMGALIHQESTFNNKLAVDLPVTKQGIYFVKAFDGERQYNQKIIVQ